MKQTVQNWMKTTGLHSGLFSTNSDPKAVTFMFNESYNRLGGKSGREGVIAWI